MSESALCSAMMGTWGWCCHSVWWWHWGLALVALGKEPKCVNLPHKVGHAGPSSKPKPNHKNPQHNECIQDIHCSPAWHEERGLLCGILHTMRKNKHSDLLILEGPYTTVVLLGKIREKGHAMMPNWEISQDCQQCLWG